MGIQVKEELKKELCRILCLSAKCTSICCSYVERAELTTGECSRSEAAASGARVPGLCPCLGRHNNDHLSLREYFKADTVKSCSSPRAAAANAPLPTVPGWAGAGSKKADNGV